MDLLPGGFRRNAEHGSSSYSFQPKVAYVPLKDEKKMEKEAENKNKTLKNKLRDSL